MIVFLGKSPRYNLLIQRCPGSSQEGGWPGPGGYSVLICFSEDRGKGSLLVSGEGGGRGQQRPARSATDMVAVTVGFLIPFLFPVNNSSLNP